jgi:hypothetical protein
MVVVAITQNSVIEQALTEVLHHLEVEALIQGKQAAVKPHDIWASAEAHEVRCRTKWYQAREGA